MIELSQDEEIKEYEGICVEVMKKTERVDKSSFQLISVIGTGAYGKVLLVKKKDGAGNYYAMKVIKKKHIRMKNQVEHTWNERKILERISSPFIIKMKYAF